MKQLTKTRIIGIVALAIALWAFYTQKPGALGLAIVGVVLIVTPTKYGSSVFKDFVKTGSKFKTVCLVAAIDALFFLATWLCMMFSNWVIEAKIKTVQQSMTIGKHLFANPQLSAQGASAIQSVVLYLLAIGVFFVLFVLVAYTVSRGFIWSTIAGKKVDKKFFLKLAGLNVLFGIIFSPLLVMVGIAAKTSGSTQAASSALPLIFVAAYFIALIHTIFVNTKKVGHSLASGIGWGIARFYKLIVPYAFAFLVYIILYQLFRSFQYAQPTILTIASIVFVVIFLAWLRVFLYPTLKTIAPK